VKPAALGLPVPPPSDAVVLFDGQGLDAWRDRDRGPARWEVRDGYMEAVPGSGYLVTAQGFGDVQLHVEWAAPNPPHGAGQERGNSGVFLMGKYEVQILDSYQSDTYPDGQAGSIYGQYPPLANVCLPPGEWQAFDIVFRRPRFDHQGQVVKPARMTVVHNGVLVQDACELWGPTSWLKNFPYEAHPDRLPLALQDHGNPIRFRNIWLRELPEVAPPGPSQPLVRQYHPVPLEQLERVAGAYVFADGTPLSVTHVEGRLWLQPSGRQRLELMPVSGTEFMLRSTAGQVEFRGDEAGAPREIVMTLGGRTYEGRRAEP
jgi:hypothetical protein